MAAINKPEVVLDALTESLRKQLKQEINGEELTNPERFALDIKFGLTDVLLLQSEKDLIAAEEAALARA